MLLYPLPPHFCVVPEISAEFLGVRTHTIRRREHDSPHSRKQPWRFHKHLAENDASRFLRAFAGCQPHSGAVDQCTDEERPNGRVPARNRPRTSCDSHLVRHVSVLLRILSVLGRAEPF